jgi:nitrogen regulatory protein P-II 1
MKLISSLVRSARLDAVKQALSGINVVALSVVEAHDYAPQRRATTAWMGHLYALESSLKMEIQVVVHDDDVDEVVGLVMRAARTGTIGDGHICVMPVEHRYNIYSGRREV